MNGHLIVEATAALLFVRSWGDLRLALEQVNDLLALRRRDRGDDSILALCFRRDLDSRLPPLRTTTDKTGSPELFLVIHESVSLSGIWTLLSLSGPAFCGVSNSAQQREAILDAFATVLSLPDSRESFCPVFAQDQSPESVAMEMRRLKERYPLLMGQMSFRQDSGRGLYGE